MPTSSLYAVAIYSPQSQKLTVCSIVDRYTKLAIANIDHPIMLFNFLNDSIIQYFVVFVNANL